jgi:Tfp pilus assembly protein PilZ
MAEKRNAWRVRKRLQLRFGQDKPNRLAYTEDFGPGGMFIRTATIFPLGTKLIVEITLADNSQVRCSGMVRWSKNVPANLMHLVKKSGMGIKIIDFIAGESIYNKMIAELE